MTDEGESMNSEQAADLAALQATASDAPALPGEVAAISVDLAKEISGLIGVIVATVGPMFPSLVLIYTDDVTKTAGGAIAAVCDKHGWMQAGMFGEFGEEIACAAIIGPLAFTSYKGIQADIEKRKKKEPERIEASIADGAVITPETIQTAASKTVTFGAPA